MNDPENPDLSNDDSAWRQLTASDSDFFDRDTSNILSDFGWNTSNHPHNLRFDSDFTQPTGVTTNLYPSTTSSCSSSAVAVTEVSTPNNPSATSSSSEDPAENSTASVAKTPPPETPWVLFYLPRRETRVSFFFFYRGPIVIYFIIYVVGGGGGGEGFTLGPKPKPSFFSHLSIFLSSFFSIARKMEMCFVRTVDISRELGRDNLVILGWIVGGSWEETIMMMEGEWEEHRRYCGCAY